MEELSIEEKAQRYDEAIERAESIYNETAIPSATTKGICTYIFLELKESEDEKIRKELINYFLPVDARDLKKQKWVAWLEKQGEQKPAEWSEEDYTMRQRILQDLLNIKTEYPKLNIDDEIEWFKSRYPQLQWKPSDEQMNALDSTLQYNNVSYNSFEHLNSLFNDLKKLMEE